MLGEEQSIDISRGVSVKLMHNGSKNMNVNGSNATPIIFEAKPPQGKKWRITRMVGYLEGVKPFSAEKFADLTAPKALGKEDRTLAGVWNIKEAFGNAILVDSTNGIQFKIKDNLTAITAFNVTVQGQEV